VASRLLDQYATVLAFHDQRVRSLSNAELPEDFLDGRRAYERVHSELIAARKTYWDHVQWHDCRT
jgi:hypothetical protein